MHEQRGTNKGLDEQKGMNRGGQTERHENVTGRMGRSNRGSYGKPTPGATFHYDFFSFFFFMNFVVALLKILTLFMLWRAQFLLEFYTDKCVYDSGTPICARIFQ